MKYRELGRTSLKVSEISLGCSGYWGNKRYSEKSASSIINQAFDRGVNFFDTGHNYSNFNAEPRLGRILKDILSITDRSKFVISSKGGTLIGSSRVFSRKHIATKDFSPDAIEASCLASIKNLNCKYLDIFQLHGITESQISKPLIKRLKNMKKKGLYRCLGINSHIESDLVYVSKHPEIFDMVLLDYNVLQLDREKVIDKLAKAQIGVVAGTILAQGHLVKRKIGSIKTGSFFWYFARSLLRRSSRRLAVNSKQMRNILFSIPNMSAAQAAASYILLNKSVTSVCLELPIFLIYMKLLMLLIKFSTKIVSVQY